jgi:hypothetical protein
VYRMLGQDSHLTRLCRSITSWAVHPISTALDSGSLVLALSTRLSWRTTPCESLLFAVKFVTGHAY